MERTGYDSCGMESPPPAYYWRNGALAEAAQLANAVDWVARAHAPGAVCVCVLSLIHISEPTRRS
eukprot:1580895-Prymnesium_polylepis.1